MVTSSLKALGFFMQYPILFYKNDVAQRRRTGHGAWRYVLALPKLVLNDLSVQTIFMVLCVPAALPLSRHCYTIISSLECLYREASLALLLHSQSL